MKNIREELKSVKLVKEDGDYYLDITYEYENEKGVYERRIPRVLLPLPKNNLPTADYCRGDFRDCGYFALILGSETILPLLRFFDEESSNNLDYCYKDTPILLKTKKLTVAEIEEKLGYKIEIVSEEK